MSRTLAEIDGDTTLLTVNNRLAAELRARFDEAQVRAGRHVWSSADILPWRAWLERQYQQLLDSGFAELDLLTPGQERRLWRAVIDRDGERHGLLRPDAAARSAQEAYSLIGDWQLTHDMLAALGGDETQVFLRWAGAFSSELAKRGLLSQAQLLPLLTRAVEHGALTAPQHLVLSGFEALSPAQTALLARLEDRGCSTDEHAEHGDAGDCRRYEATDGDSEIRRAAEWARRQLEVQPGSRLAIVTPLLGQRRHALERILREVLSPDDYLAASGDRQLFDISLGEPLDTRPLVAHALLALDLLTGEQPQHRVGQLLRSPFLGGHAAEWERRALLDVALRRDAPALLGLRQLRFQLGRFTDDDLRHCPDMAGRLRELTDFAHALPARAGTNAWSAHLQRALRILGWPGDLPPDSQEFQQQERMRRVFSELAELEKVCRQMSLHEALGELRTLTADTVFQAESPPAPVRVLGPLEAAGLAFDGLWLLDMDDQSWPPAPQPNPLLPARLQRDRGMPHASAVRELAFAGSLTGRLTRCAPQLIASHARTNGDREQRPSPLVRDWPLIDAAELATTGGTTLRDLCVYSGDLQAMPMPHADRPPSQARGGASLVAAQANCPFQAVSAFRLQARPLQEPLSAPDAALIGDLVHGLLQRIWQQLHDAQGLAGLDDSGLAETVEPLATAILEDFGRRRPDLFTPGFRAIEAERLTRLVCSWLATERLRTQPFEVIALEQRQSFDVQGLELSTRADRVDRLADGTLAIIDYKTGRNTRIDGWFDARLSEPQLPLYALHGGGEVGATLLARVRNDAAGCAFVGLSREPDFAPGVFTADQIDDATDWSQTLARWREAVDRLVTEITGGRADPTPSPQACGYCVFGALCRVQEMIVEDDGD